MAKGTDTVNAALYLRISEDKDNTEDGVTRQREDCQKLARDRGWRFTEYKDNDISAKVADKRPAFKQMLADIRAGLINRVVAERLDRLARNPRDRLALVEACKEYGVTITLVKGSEMDPTTASGRMVIGVLGEGAQMEIDIKGERQSRAAQQRAERGAVWSPCRLFGYTRPDSHGYGMTIVEAEAKLLRDAYAGVLAGRSLMGITRDWNESGSRTVKGNPWVAKVVRDVLLNPRNAGIRTYRGEELGKGDWDPIVDEDVFRGVVAVLRDPARTRRPVNGYGRKYLLTGLAICGACGGKMHTTRSGHGSRPIYGCRGCNGVSRQVAHVDAWVIGHVVDCLSRPETLRLLTAVDRPEQAGLRLRKDALVQRQGEIKLMLTDPDMPIAQVKAAAADIRSKIEDINAQLSDANTVRVFDGALPDEDDRDKFYALPEDQRYAIAAARFDALPLDRKRAVVDKLVSVKVLPGQPSRAAFRTDLVPVLPKATA